MNMTLEQVAYSARALAAQYKAGTPSVQGAGILGRVQPDCAPLWNEAAQRMANGATLSATLEQAWPGELLAVLRAGEEAGKTQAVLEQIYGSVRLQLNLKQEIGRLKTPLSILGFGVAVFLFMMLYVIPSFNGGRGISLATRDIDPFTRLSLLLSASITPIWQPLAAGLALAVAALYQWSRTAEGKQSLVDASLNAPFFGASLKNFHYALWARFLSTVFSAGIPLIHGLSLTATGLPTALRDGVSLFEHELKNQNLAVQDAADSGRWPEHDARHAWPPYLAEAFIAGANTGQIDTELMAASGLIMDYAQAQFDIALKRSMLLAYLVCSGLVLACITALYLPILTSLKQL